MNNTHQHTVRAHLDADSAGTTMMMRLYETGSPDAWLKSDVTMEIEE